jgi:hypothetical protein
LELEIHNIYGESGKTALVTPTFPRNVADDNLDKGNSSTTPYHHQPSKAAADSFETTEQAPPRGRCQKAAAARTKCSQTTFIRSRVCSHFGQSASVRPSVRRVCTMDDQVKCRYATLQLGGGGGCSVAYQAAGPPLQPSFSLSPVKSNGRQVL